MAELPEKDGYDIIIDFVIGAVLAGPALAWVWLKMSGNEMTPEEWKASHTLVCLVMGGAGMGGALGVMFRSLFWIFLGALLSPDNVGREDIREPDKRLPLWGRIVFPLLFILSLIFVVVMVGGKK